MFFGGHWLIIWSFWRIHWAIILISIFFSWAFWFILGLFDDEKSRFDNNGDNYEAEWYHEGAGKTPIQEICSKVIACKSSHKKWENKGHGEGNGFSNFLDSGLVFLVLEVVIFYFLLGIYIFNQPELSFALELIKVFCLFSSLLLFLHENFHLIISNYIVSANLFMDLEIMLHGYFF